MDDNACIDSDGPPVVFHDTAKSPYELTFHQLLTHDSDTIVYIITCYIFFFLQQPTVRWADAYMARFLVTRAGKSRFLEKKFLGF